VTSRADILTVKIVVAVAATAVVEANKARLRVAATGSGRKAQRNAQRLRFTAAHFTPPRCATSRGSCGDFGSAMPTTRAARRAAAERQLLELPADVLGHVLYQLPLAHDIALTGRTCRALCVAAKLALKARPFSGEVVTLAAPNSGPVRAVAVTSDGVIITGSATIRRDIWGLPPRPRRPDLWLWRDGVCVRALETRQLLHALAALPHGRFVCGYNDHVVDVHEDGRDVPLRTINPDFFVWCAAAMPDGEHFMVGGQLPHAISLYHVDGTLIHAFEGHTGPVLAVAVTPDGQHIVSGSRDKLVNVWSVASKSLVSTCAGHTKGVDAVAAMPDGQRILSGSEDTTVRVWLLDGTLKKTFKLHGNEVTAVVALPDNHHALSGSEDFFVKLFNVDDGNVLRTFRHHLGPVFSLALMPDGRRFVSGSADKSALVIEHGLAPHRP